MKLTKVTSILGWYSDSVNGVEEEVKEARKQVKEWREDAENLAKLTKGTSLQKVLDNTIIVEQVKKRLEECETNSNGISMKDDWVEYKFQMRLVPELKKLMEGKK